MSHIVFRSGGPQFYPVPASHIILMPGVVSYQGHVASRRIRPEAGVLLVQGEPPIVEAWNPDSELPVDTQRIITPAEFRQSPSVIVVDARLLRYLDDQPERILSLKWRDFETLICTLLEGFGYRVIQSPAGRDGGVDIVAERDTNVGPELVVVQCKRFAPNRKVSEPVVKQFCTEIADRGATRGLIATTSTFTRVALKYIELKRHRMTGADGERVQQWIRQHNAKVAK